MATGPHGLDGLVDEVIQIPAQHLRPWRMTSREQPAANFLSLNFFFTDLTSRSDTLLDGRMMAAAPMRPVSSSVAKRIFSI